MGIPRSHLKRMGGHAADSEKALQEAIVAMLHQRGVKRVVRSRMDKRTTTAIGTPDLLFCYRSKGRVIPMAWEVKLRAKTTPEQTIAGVEFQNDGWRWSIVYSLHEANAILDCME